ncbi:hypothetical protein ACIGCZ_00885 [Streptomyces nigra]|uniref:hypothetical protein n=1 Tax=Streptomyces nigra TaxID=1827580 RepID=UPI0037D1B6AD
MTTERTTDPIALQAQTIEALAELARRHPDLPSAYVTIHEPWRGKVARLDLQLHTPTGFNQWMAVLGVQPEDVDMHPSGRASWLEGSTVRAGIHITIAVHGILLTVEQTDAPRSLSEVAA